MMSGERARKAVCLQRGRVDSGGWERGGCGKWETLLNSCQQPESSSKRADHQNVCSAKGKEKKEASYYSGFIVTALLVLRLGLESAGDTQRDRGECSQL